MRYSDSPNPGFPFPPEMNNYVLHAEMMISGTRVNFSDTQSDVIPGGMITLAVDLPTEEEVRSVYSQLSEGGEVLIQLAPQFFSPLYGWVLDKFGIGWQIICRA